MAGRFIGSDEMLLWVGDWPLLFLGMVAPCEPAQVRAHIKQGVAHARTGDGMGWPTASTKMKTGQFAAVKLGHEASELMLGSNRKFEDGN